LVQTIHESQSSSSNGQEEILKRIVALERRIQGLPSDQRETPRGKTSVSPKIGLAIPNELSPSQKIPKAEVRTVELGDTVKGSNLNLSIETIQERWNDVLDQVKKRKKSTQAFLMEGKPVQLEENTLTILFREGCSFHKDKVNQIENRQTIEEVLKQLFGISFSLENFMENEFKTKETPENEDLEKQEQTLINKAKDMFGSDLVVVRDE